MVRLDEPPPDGPDATVAEAGNLLWVHRTGAARHETAATAALEAQVAGLREVGDLLRRQLNEVREDRDRWRSQAESLQRFITDADHQGRLDPVQEDGAPRRPDAAEQLIAGIDQDQQPWWRRIVSREDVKLVALLGCIVWMLIIIATTLK